MGKSFEKSGREKKSNIFDMEETQTNLKKKEMVGAVGEERNKWGQKEWNKTIEFMTIELLPQAFRLVD